MSTAQKILAAMANNPRDWSIAQVVTVARANGLTVHCPGGSHHIVRNAIYIKQLVRMIQTGKGDNE